MWFSRPTGAVTFKTNLTDCFYQPQSFLQSADHHLIICRSSADNRATVRRLIKPKYDFFASVSMRVLYAVVELTVCT